MERGLTMTDKEKLEYIRKLVLNLPAIDFTDVQVGIGVAHAMNVAIELILEVGEKE